jgi:hypothetical protein
MPTTQDVCFDNGNWREREHYGAAYYRVSRLLSKDAYSNAPVIKVRCGRFFKAVTDLYSKAVPVRSRMAVDPQPVEILALEKAAENADIQEFGRLARAITWSSYRPTDLTKVIDLSLSLDMISLAKELIQKGSELFPQDKRLQHALAVLASPPVVRKRSGKARNLEISKNWIKKHASEYKGQWIAVYNGVLLGAAPTVKELYKQIGPGDKIAEIIIVNVMT